MKTTLADIRKAIPKECFQKNLALSLIYMAFDFMMLIVLYVYKDEFPYILWVNLTGFVMWCIFVVGHDCGHTTFSNYAIVNDVCGHICHTILNVPFYPWKFSHNLHHRFHNHFEKDKSHIWIKEAEQNILHLFFQIPLVELVAYTCFYLWVGVPDGSHVLPNSKLFTSLKDRAQCFVSVATIVVFDLFLYFNFSFSNVLHFYIVPVMIFNFWLFLVTYMQHHHESTKVYEDKEWSFYKGGMETVDRTYGFGIDSLSHNITNCHFVHHLFFTKIPHYHLKAATEAMKPLLDKEYKHESSWDFIFEFHRLKYTLRYLKGEGVLHF
eukprot:NODE_594_length_6300_cov_0.153201.p4 type:complete len:323 gc:universal NODE_594_length_6300_cov_0.153201:2184-3152(+)